MNDNESKPTLSELLAIIDDELRRISESGERIDAKAAAVDAIMAEIRARLQHNERQQPSRLTPDPE